VCSLEPWDEVWRRNQFFVDALLKRFPALRVLFVEPPADVLYEIAQHRRPTLPRTRSLRSDGRLAALRPLKPLPRRCGSVVDRALERSVIRAARRLGFVQPVLWLNDVTYAPMIERTGWPTVYDVTDDWLLAPLSARTLDRLRKLDAIALNHADEVVVCSPTLAASREASRPVTLVPNGVDSEHFQRPQSRPLDLVPAPTVLYLGTLHEARLDIDLVIELATSLPDVAVILVGPDALAPVTQRRLRRLPNIHSLGSRPYSDVPAYLQHADVVIVPHLVTPFTDSLDPIKAYECLAVSTPTVATPVAGFRELADRLTVVVPDLFVEAVRSALRTSPRPANPSEPVTWKARASEFEHVLGRVASKTTPSRKMSR